jgi:FkbM family methyltransferase
MKAQLRTWLLQAAGALAAGSDHRPFGDMANCLGDLQALGFRPKAILDVGANCGEWSRLAKSVFPEADFCLVEPQPEMRESLEGFCREFSGSRWVQAGAGPQPGELVQTIWKDLAGSSFLPEIKDELLASGRQRRAQIVTLDSLYAEGQRLPDLAKLDIQGFELEALKGAGKLFGKTELFILEVSLFCFLPKNPVTSDVVSFMHERGYELYDIAGYLRRPHDGALGQLDLAFARDGGFFRRTNAW